MCGGILSTQGVVVFLLRPRLLLLQLRKKEPGEMIANSNHPLMLILRILSICYFLCSFQPPYEIGILLSHFINKQTEAEKGCVPCSPLTVN